MAATEAEVTDRGGASRFGVLTMAPDFAAAGCRSECACPMLTMTRPSPTTPVAASTPTVLLTRTG